MSESQTLIDPAAMKEILPLLPLKGTVIFPHQVQGLGVGRPKSLRALEAALAGEPRLIVLAAQKEDDLDNPGPDDIYRTGSVCRILQVGKQPDGVLQVIVEGVVRARSWSMRRRTRSSPCATRPSPTRRRRAWSWRR